MTTSIKNEGSGASPTKNTRHFPKAAYARKQMQRNYYIMRRTSFQAMSQNIMKGSELMVIRQLKEKQFESLCNSLRMKAHAEPLEASYTVNLKINGAEYAVKVQPERHNKMAVLQALRVYRHEYGPDYELITTGKVLSSLLEILIFQGVV